jgi:hypothetical protein
VAEPKLGLAKNAGGSPLEPGRLRAEEGYGYYEEVVVPLSQFAIKSERGV